MRFGVLVAALALGVACDPPINSLPTVHFTRAGTGGSVLTNDVRQRIDRPVELNVLLDDIEGGELELVINAVDYGGAHPSAEVFRQTYAYDVWSLGDTAVQFDAPFAGDQGFEAVVNDGVADSAVEALPAFINGPPTSPEVTIYVGGEPVMTLHTEADPLDAAIEVQSNASVTAEITTPGVDANDDQINYTLRWREGERVTGPTTSGQQTSLELPPTSTSVGEHWALQVAWYDTPDGVRAYENDLGFAEDGVWLNLTITAPLDLPSVPAVAILPQDATSANALTCSVTVPSSTTSAGAVPSYIYTWRQGAAVEPAYTGPVVPASAVLPGRMWSCTARGVTSGGLEGDDSAEAVVNVRTSSATSLLSSTEVRIFPGAVLGGGLGEAAVRYDVDGNGVDDLLVGETGFADGTHPNDNGRIAVYDVDQLAGGTTTPWASLVGPDFSLMGSAFSVVPGGLTGAKPALLMGASDQVLVLDGTLALATAQQSQPLLLSLNDGGAPTVVGEAFAAGPFFGRPLGADVAVLQRGATSANTAVWMLNGLDIQAALASGTLEVTTGRGFATNAVEPTNWGHSLALGGHPASTGTAAIAIGTPDLTPGTFAVVGTSADLGALGTTSGTFATELLVDTPTNATRMGWQVAWLGDLTGDGLDELLVSAPDEDNGKGALYVFEGWGVAQQLHTSDAMTVIRGTTLGAHFGEEVRLVGDISGDGHPELLVSAPSNSAVFLIDSADLASRDVNLKDTGVGAQWLGSVSQLLAGDVGDLTGDGYPDLVIGDPQASPGAVAQSGRFFIVDSYGPYGL